MATFSVAPEALDEDIAVLLTNSFLPIWNHNWFQGISAPIPRIPQRQPSRVVSLHLASNLSTLQKSRLSLYQFLIKITRLTGGDVSIVTIPSPNDSSSECIAAALLFCPPQKQNASTFSLAFMRDLWLHYKAGVIRPLYGYGLGGFHRVTAVFEANVERMFEESLPELGFKKEECGFVQMIAVNSDPELDHLVRGKGFARQLLEWRMAKHWKECATPGSITNGRLTPVILDTTTDQGRVAYGRIGFKVVNSHTPNTGCDAQGFKLKKNLKKEEIAVLEAEREKNCVMCIMVKMPPDTHTIEGEDHSINQQESA